MSRVKAEKALSLRRLVQFWLKAVLAQIVKRHILLGLNIRFGLFPELFAVVGIDKYRTGPLLVIQFRDKLTNLPKISYADIPLTGKTTERSVITALTECDIGVETLLETTLIIGQSFFCTVWVAQSHPQAFPAIRFIPEIHRRNGPRLSQRLFEHLLRGYAVTNDIHTP